MTVKGFLFLLAVTMAAIAIGAVAGDRFAAPGLARTLVVAAVAAPIVLLAGRYAEHRGWVSGSWQLDRQRNAASTTSSTSTTSAAGDTDRDQARPADRGDAAAADPNESTGARK